MVYFLIMRKRLIKCLSATTAILVFWAVWDAVLIWNYGKTDETRAADVIIVLGAGTDGEEVSPVFRERINHGVWLYKNGYAGKLILTGGYGEGNARSDARVAGNYAAALGVPKTDIRMEEKSTVTQENIRYAKEIMDREVFFYMGYQVWRIGKG